MARRPADTPVNAAPSNIGEKIAESLSKARAERIRLARARTPTPTYEQIAIEVGCCVKTVYNVLNDRTHAA